MREWRDAFGIALKTDLKILRIVVVSPSDVPEEKTRVASVVKEINHSLSISGQGVRLELRSWELVPPGLHPLGPQGLIDEYLNPSQADIVLGIFWKHFGTPVLDARSGTEHEIRRAVDHWSEHGAPDVKLYFNSNVRLPSVNDVRQYQQIVEFKAEFLPKVLVREYDGVEDFERLIRSDLLTKCFQETGKASIPLSSNPALLLIATATPRLARREGLSESIGAIEITLQQVTDPLPLPCECDVYVALNTNITSRQVGSGISSALSGAEATSASGVQSYTITGPTPGSLIDATLSFRDESGKLSSTVPVNGKLVNFNFVLFESVTFDAKLRRKAEITGLRANVNGLPLDGSVMALISVRPRPKQAEVHLLNASVLVAMVSWAGEFRVRTKNDGTFEKLLFRQTSGHNPNIPKAEIDFVLQFRELFPGAFKSRAQESINSTADSGTILLAKFANISPNVELFVTKHDFGATTRESAKAVSLTAQKYSDLVDFFPLSTDSALFEAFAGEETIETALASGVPIIRVPVIGGYGCVAWECILKGSEFPGNLNEANFGVIVSIQPGSFRDPKCAQLGTSCVSGTLAPISVQIVSSSAPIPRFANVGKMIEVFSITP